MNHFESQASSDSNYPIKAFTLIELLTVIAVIAVLAGILVASLRSAYISSQKVVATNNLRQIGVAMKLFVQDNNTLPGPLWRAQTPYYAGDSRSLAYNLAPYLDLPEPDGQQHDFPYLSSPLFETSRPVKNTPGYIVCERASFLDGSKVDPWGYKKDGDETFTGPQNGTYFYANVTEDSWALRAFDAGNNANPAAGWADRLLDEPLFAGGRHYLYFSGRVDFVEED